MPDHSAPLTERQYVVPFVLVTSLFFLWALGVNLNDVLVPHLKKAGAQGRGKRGPAKAS